ncbi:coil containing protein [Vibrio phage 1.122.B._10N.286.46.F8]|nr:coil containing protein [Vibrio phage 1.013.O._10N.286.54.F9]AUR89314.1 coil containing protein [Vibrio phage 1.122.A._10N.286.46.F8]AUR89383.1 coil containing protein [Vibrio phage 1.122.B._10N.286.46.F8]
MSLGSAEYKIEADTSEAIKDMKALVSELDDMTNQIKKSESEVKSFESSVKSLGGSISDTGKVFDKAGQENKKLTDTYALLKDQMARTKTQGVDVITNSYTKAQPKVNAITKSFKVQKGAMQQLGFQVQDFAVQVAGGTSALTAFGQQGSQLAGILGPGGAIIGALIAVGSAIIGVGVNALSTAGAIDTFLEKVKELDEEGLSQLAGQQQQTAIANTEKTINKLTYSIEKTRRETEKLAKQEADLIKQRDASRDKGFAGAVETARLVNLRKEMEANQITLQNLIEEQTKEEDKLKLLTKETNINQESIDKQVGTIEELASVIGKSASGIAMHNKELALAKLAADGATEAEISRAAAAHDLIIAQTQKIEREREETKAVKDKTKADREAAKAEREKQQAKANLAAADPIIAVSTQRDDSIANLQAQLDAELITEQTYADRKVEITRNAEAQIQQITEERFRAQSEANDVLIGSLNAVGSTAASAMSSLITGGANALDVINSLASAVLNQAIGALVELGLQQVKNQIIGQTAATAAAATSAATGTAIATAYAPAAALASLASFGANAAPASAGIASTVGLASGLAVSGLERGGVLGGGLTEMGEGNSPEVLKTDNGIFAVPGSRGRVFNQEQLSQIGGGGVKVNSIINNYASSATVDSQVKTQEDGSIIIETIVADIRAGNGPVSSAMNQAYPALTRKTK